MKRIQIVLGIICLSVSSAMAQNTTNAKVDYPGFEQLTKDVYAYREARLISIETFNEYSKDPNTIILDTRSERAFNTVHVKGAVHLNFSDFTAAKLAKVIPDTNTRILIYCNNNFDFDQMEAMVSKSMPLALNIPTFINLYGYGYTNIYELKDYLNQYDPRVTFEGKGWIPLAPLGSSTLAKTDSLIAH